MIDRLIDLLISVARFFRFWIVVKEFECCVSLRFGKFHRQFEPGLHFIAPLLIDTIFSDTKVLSVKPLEAQTLTLRDGKTVVVRGIISMEVHDPRAYFLSVDTAEAALSDSSVGAIADVLRNGTWQDLLGGSLSGKITRLVRENAKKFGINVLNVQLGDVSLGKAHKLYIDNTNMYKSSGYDS